MIEAIIETVLEIAADVAEAVFWEKRKKKKERQAETAKTHRV